jgi:hypothetical protein
MPPKRQRRPNGIFGVRSSFSHRVKMFTIAGGILLAVLVLSLLRWLLVGAAWVAGITLVIAIAGGAIWALWTGAQSLAGLAVELTIGAVFLIWLYFKMPPRPPGAPNFVVRFLRGWVRIISAPVLAPMEYWRSIQNRRLQGERVNAVAAMAGLTWSCCVGVFLSWFAILLPVLAVWGVLGHIIQKGCQRGPIEIRLRATRRLDQLGARCVAINAVSGRSDTILQTRATRPGLFEASGRSCRPASADP